MLKSNIKWLLIMLLMPVLASCSWEDLPAYEEADITGVQFRYRWANYDDKDAITGEPIVYEIQLNRTSININSDAGTIELGLSVPAASNTFPADERAKVSLNPLWCQVTLSTAARIFPDNGSKPLGTPEDWTVPHSYTVKAADGTTKTWTIKVTGLQK